MADFLLETNNVPASARNDAARRSFPLTACVLLAVQLCLPAVAEAGGLYGRVSSRDGVGVPGTRVAIEGMAETTYTDHDGRYWFPDVASGSHALTFTYGEYESRRENVQVAADDTTRLETIVDWDVFYMDVITVTAPSRRPERIADAPNAATKLSAGDIEKEAVAGQLARALRFTPGAELTQSGLYDFNLNTRGFNTAINRRVLTIVDWRDSSVPAVLGNQEWSALSAPLDDIDSIEFIRGPGAALYGAGAFNGVLDIRTKSPRDYPGGRLSIAGGDLDTQRYDVRHAGSLAPDLYYKVQGGYQRSDDFTRSRVGTVEYAPGSLLPELVPPDENRTYYYGSARLDKFFDSGAQLTAEVGTATAENFVTVAPTGRSQAREAHRPWARLLFSEDSWNVTAYYTGRDANDLVNLGAGNSVYLDSYNIGADFQWNASFQDGSGRIVAGASAGRQEVDSLNPQGFHTVFDEVETADRWALFGQVDYDFSDQWKGVLSLRYDDSSLHDGQLSPRIALVWKPLAAHTFRASFSDAFQRPSVAEFFLNTPIGAPVDLTLLEASLAPLLGSVPLGFTNVPVLAVGNENLRLEEVQTLELGWKGVFARSTFVELSVYRSEISNFTSNLLPNVGSSLGRLNADFGPYAPPAELAPMAAQAVLGALAAALPPELLLLLSNDPQSGAPIFAAASFGNFGEAETFGIEFGINHSFLDRWRVDFNYTYFDSDISRIAPENVLVPNAPRHSASAGILFETDRWDWALRYRWVDDFPWSAGLYQGPIDSYGTADLYVNYLINDRFKIGLESANLFDDEHYQLFGGDLLQRRTMIHLAYSW